MYYVEDLKFPFKNNLRFIRFLISGHFYIPKRAQETPKIPKREIPILNVINYLDILTQILIYMVFLTRKKHGHIYIRNTAHNCQKAAIKFLVGP